ncbi:hypothetical protein DSO57_1003242 [Entomophthora muscae]|uniref:Uncharacterized protein n=1 Tax=Entomophthora muscae TaxID=34485 RepID=A0ACC2TVR6_9FUNG|nr:hypothetical protein DSO57_1003242 [Entomophthora muscae]
MKVAGLLQAAAIWGVCLGSPSGEAAVDGPKTEVRKIIFSGDPKNWIDVVFMGDGYTKKEKKKFFNDIERLTKDMFKGVTFRSWLPLFNIWVITC